MGRRPSLSSPYVEQIIYLLKDTVSMVAAGRPLDFTLASAPVKPGSLSVIETLFRDLADGVIYNDDGLAVGRIDYSTGRLELDASQLHGRKTLTVRYCYRRRASNADA